MCCPSKGFGGEREPELTELGRGKEATVEVEAVLLGPMLNLENELEVSSRDGMSSLLEDREDCEGPITGLIVADKFGIQRGALFC